MKRSKNLNKSVILPYSLIEKSLRKNKKPKKLVSGSQRQKYHIKPSTKKILNSPKFSIKVSETVKLISKNI